MCSSPVRVDRQSAESEPLMEVSSSDWDNSAWDQKEIVQDKIEEFRKKQVWSRVCAVFCIERCELKAEKSPPPQEPEIDFFSDIPAEVKKTKVGKHHESSWFHSLLGSRTS